MSKTLLQYTAEELQNRYANAHLTYMQAGGHGKADRNKAAYEAYLAALRSRGGDTDNRDGVFNGAGSV